MHVQLSKKIMVASCKQEIAIDLGQFFFPLCKKGKSH